ncbi:FHA domain-containing protein [Kallipyga gabonensis]|uniref:FHA domain-containing protein n=1 Tax=Kallipyga gabonensis TaxID=1686287 RepID=UPI0006B554C2|nr:FHA domain-containing protein [Kallipyga gabonensis]
MDKVFDLLEQVFFRDLFGEINLYIILSTVIKFVFVIIVLAFIARIVKMISMDIRSSYSRPESDNPYLRFLGDPSMVNFPVRDEYYLTDNTRIGRADDNNVILKDRTISKHQAVLIQEGTNFLIDDLGATNPTLVNGQVVDQPMPVHDRDIIRLGQLDFMFIEGKDNE